MICYVFRRIKTLLQINSSFHSTSFCLIVFLSCRHFCLLRHFEIIRCIVKSLIAIQHIFVAVQLKKRPDQYTHISNKPDTSLKTPVFESLFNEVASLEACNFVKKYLQGRSFAVNIGKFSQEQPFLWNTSDGYFWKNTVFTMKTSRGTPNISRLHF